MKSEVSFFRDRRANGPAALLETMRAIGMSDHEIKVALLKQLSDDAYAKYEAARALGSTDAISAAYNAYRDAYARWYTASEE